MVWSKGGAWIGFRSGVLGIALLLMIMFVGLGNAAAATTHYIAANGSDSNNGTSTSTPWLHAPGMPSCSGSCASYTPQPGDQFIFRGGDTWHFGNSGATPYTGGTWSWVWNGASGNPIYIGVNQSWYTGGSWTRPMLNADNPTSTGEVASCLHQTGSSNNMWVTVNQSFITLDNFELLGVCNSRTSQVNLNDTYINNNASHHMTFQNLYIHGWTNTTFGCGAGGSCVSITAFGGGSGGMGPTQQTGDVYDHIVVDGSDSDPHGIILVLFEGMYQVQYSLFKNVSQAVFTFSHILHDTTFDHFYFRPPGNGHDNMWEANANQNAGSVNASYNNVFSNIYPSGSNGNVVIWPAPEVGTTTYWFNNVGTQVNGGGNYFDIGQNGSDQGSMVVFNNTFESADNNPILFCQSTNSHVFTEANNHFITNYGSAYSSPCSGKTSVTPLLQTHAAANAQGYNSSENFAWSPAGGGGSTVASGTNEQSFCSALSTAGLSAAGTACQYDTTYACAYNTSNHTLSCPARTPVARPASAAWDVGAYQSGQSSSGPNPPSGLTAVIN